MSVDKTSDQGDQVTPIINRALAEIARRERPVPGTDTERLTAESRDLLDDLESLLRDDADRVRLSDLPARLRDLAPSWGSYRNLTATALREQLSAEGVRVTNTGNVPQLSPADLRHALTERE